MLLLPGQVAMEVVGTWKKLVIAQRSSRDFVACKEGESGNKSGQQMLTLACDKNNSNNNYTKYSDWGYTIQCPCLQHVVSRSQTAIFAQTPPSQKTVWELTPVFFLTGVRGSWDRRLFMIPL